MSARRGLLALAAALAALPGDARAASPRAAAAARPYAAGASLAVAASPPPNTPQVPEHAEDLRSLEPSVAAAAPLLSDEEASRTIAALTALPKVRAFFAPAPGFGHQSATLAAIRRLRELGFAGEIEAVYDNAPTRHAVSLAEKLGALLPGFSAAAPSVQRLPALDMTVETLGSFVSREREPVALGLSGGLDGSSAHLAALLHAERAVHVHPMNWDAVRVVERRGAVRPVVGTQGLPILYRPAGAREAEAALAAWGAAGEGRLDKARGLEALLSRAGDVDLMPVYGLAFLDGDGLHRLLMGLSTAAERDPARFSRGIVVPLLADASRQLPQLRTLLADPNHLGRLDRDYAAYSPSLRERLAAANAGLRERLEWASIADFSLPARLDALEPGQILLLETGAVPPAVFERLFAASTLPPTLEGKNAANLAALLGLPFLSVTDEAVRDLLAIPGRARPPEEVERVWFPRAGPGARAPRLDLSHALLSRTQLDHGFSALADFIVEAARPESALRRYFAAERVGADELARDRLVHGLRAALLP